MDEYIITKVILGVISILIIFVFGGSIQGVVPTEDHPAGITVTPDARYVTKSACNCVVKKSLIFHPPGTSSLSKFGSFGFGNDETRFSWPVGIDIDSLGNIFVVDRGNDKIKKFKPDYTFVKSWGGCGQSPGRLCDTLVT